MIAQTRTGGSKLPYIVLGFILLLSAGIRLYRLSENPPGIIPDEASFGYQAKSILETGKTFLGTSPALAFPQYGNGLYPPLYTYTLIPVIKLFGLSLFTERLPSAIFGILLCWLLYSLAKKLLSSESAALFAAFLLAVNPWAIFYSRQGRFEMIGLFLVLSGMVVYLDAVKKKHPIAIGLSATLLGLSMHANDAAKLVIPLLVPVLVFYTWNAIRRWKQGLVVFLAVFAFFFLLVCRVLFLDGQINNYTRSRLSGEVSKTVDYERTKTNAPLFLSSIVHNKATVRIHEYLSNYTSIFSLHWFFVNGNGDMRESVGRHGQYLLFELPLFFIGLVAAARKKRAFGLLLFWMLIAPLPGAITTGPFAPYRSIFLLPVPLLFSSLGFSEVLVSIRKLPVFAQILAMGFMAVVIAVFSASFLVTYFFDFPVYSSDYRYKQRTDMLVYARQHENEYAAIYVLGNFSLEYAFLSDFDPRTYQKAYQDSITRPDHAMILGKYIFRPIPPLELKTLLSSISSPTLFLADGGVLPKNVVRMKQFVGAEPLEIIYEASKADRDAAAGR